jgi:hypothetical protein
VHLDVLIVCPRSDRTFNHLFDAFDRLTFPDASGRAAHSTPYRLSHGLLGHPAHVLELVGVALASPHVPAMAAVHEPTPPDDSFGAVRSLAHIGRAVDHALALTRLCQEPGSDIAGLGHCHGADGSRRMIGEAGPPHKFAPVPLNGRVWGLRCRTREHRFWRKTDPLLRRGPRHPFISRREC